MKCSTCEHFTKGQYVSAFWCFYGDAKIPKQPDDDCEFAEERELDKALETDLT